MTCPLCATPSTPLIPTPVPGGSADASVDLCGTCAEQIAADSPNPDHFRSLATTMWSEDPAVQVLAFRTLQKIAEPWADDLLGQLYLDDDTRAWAENVAAASQHKDANGVTLNNGDTVTLIKDLTVKGANFTAKRGTAVRRISLVADNPAQIEGKVEGQRIVILTEFVKKS